MTDPRRVLILGSTGSIGTQALDVIAAHPDDFEVVGLAAGGSQPELFAAQAARHPAAALALADGPATLQLPGRRVLTGPDAATDLVSSVEADVVLNGITGSIGLAPTLAALRAGRVLALANKESLVAGGSLVTGAAAPGQIVPVDSEHSALAQCLRGGTAGEVARLVLTASGGPFRGRTAAELADGHGRSRRWPTRPGTWAPVVTLNSATLVNKGLELIEAHLLFGMPYDRIDVVVHPQSVDPLDGDLPRRVHPGPGQPARHAPADRAGAQLAATDSATSPRPATSARRRPGRSSRSTTRRSRR